jgi:hypothetical protein
LAYGAAGEEVEGFEGGDEEVEEFYGGAKGCGKGVVGCRDFAAVWGGAAAGRFLAFWRVENAGFHAGKHEQKFKLNQVFSVILKYGESGGFFAIGWPIGGSGKNGREE